MTSVNWYLVALAFVLGVALTLAFMIRRVQHEVPAPAGGGATAATLTGSVGAPHGPGSAKPAADGSGPEGWLVKGNEDSMLYHSTESPYYGRTIAEVWFRDVETAEAAGFNRWDSGKSQRPKK